MFSIFMEVVVLRSWGPGFRDIIGFLGSMAQTMEKGIATEIEHDMEIRIVQSFMKS